jgi:hypothetical protein
MIPRGRCSARSAEALAHPRAGSAAGERLCDDPPARRGCRDRNQAREPQLFATGITDYLKNGGTLEKAAAMASHASTRTTQLYHRRLYDRRRDEVRLDELERDLMAVSSGP